MYGLTTPRKFLRLSGAAAPVLGVATLVLLAGGLYLALFASPPDYQQGDSVRIMYVHVPAAWMALFCYVSLAAFAAAGLIWRQPLADLGAQATAPIGACFTLVALVTGSLWGKPMWGTWWVWDARLTSVLLLLFLYVGFIGLSHAFDDPLKGRRAASILALVGVVNVPVIKFSVDWWNTLHQPASVIRLDGPTIHASMLVPLLVMGAAFTCYYLWVLLVRLRSELLAARIHALRLRQAMG
jgi:heme exporter protein C